MSLSGVHMWGGLATHPLKKNKCATHLRNIYRRSHSWQRFIFLFKKIRKFHVIFSPLIHVYSVFVLMHSCICGQKCSWLTQILPYSISSKSFFTERRVCLKHRAQISERTCEISLGISACYRETRFPSGRRKNRNFQTGSTAASQLFKLCCKKATYLKKKKKSQATFHQQAHMRKKKRDLF